MQSDRMGLSGRQGAAGGYRDADAGQHMELCLIQPALAALPCPALHRQLLLRLAAPRQLCAVTLHRPISPHPSPTKHTRTCSSFSAWRRLASSVMSLWTPMKDSRRPEASRTGVMLQQAGGWEGARAVYGRAKAKGRKPKGLATATCPSCPACFGACQTNLPPPPPASILAPAHLSML